MANNRIYMLCDGCGQRLYVARHTGAEWHYRNDKCPDIAAFLNEHAECFDSPGDWKDFPQPIPIRLIDEHADVKAKRKMCPKMRATWCIGSACAWWDPAPEMPNQPAIGHCGATEKVENFPDPAKA